MLNHHLQASYTISRWIRMRQTTGDFAGQLHQNNAAKMGKIETGTRPQPLVSHVPAHIKHRVQPNLETRIRWT